MTSLMKSILRFGTFVSIILVMMSVDVFGITGSGGLPGGNCPVVADYQYVPPPYIGQVTVVWVDGDMLISGLVEQVGQSICVGNIPADAPAPFGTDITLEAFQALKANNLRGVCLVGYEDFFPCVLGGFLEIVGAGNIKFTSATSFTAHVVIMPLAER